MNTALKEILPDCDSRYGAPMGRANRDINNAGPVKLHLAHVPLNCGGYDRGGAYWGLRIPMKVTRDNTPPGALGKALHTYTVTPRLYCYWWKGNRKEYSRITIRGFVDATSREHAKELIRETYPEATFYR